MFVQKLPEGARTASLVNASTQIGAVCDLSNFKQLTFQEQHAVAPAWPELVMLVEVEGKDGKGD